MTYNQKTDRYECDDENTVEMIFLKKVAQALNKTAHAKDLYSPYVCTNHPTRYVPYVYAGPVEITLRDQTIYVSHMSIRGVDIFQLTDPEAITKTVERAIQLMRMAGGLGR